MSESKRMSPERILYSARQFEYYVGVCKQSLEHAVKDCATGDFKGAENAIAFGLSQLKIGQGYIESLKLDSLHSHKNVVGENK